MNHKVLITRPIEQAKNLAKVVIKLNAEPILCPIFTIEKIAYDINQLDIPSAQIITSIHAISHNIPTKWLDIPLYVVGESVANAATNYGFNNIIAVTHTALELLPIIAASPYYDFLYLRGADIAFDFASKLPNKKITQQITYNAVAINEIPTNIINNFSEINIITLYSPRSAQILMQLMKKHNLTENTSNINLLCMSNAVLESVKIYNWLSINIADTPSQTAMLDKLTDILQGNKNG